MDSLSTWDRSTASTSPAACRKGGRGAEEHTHLHTRAQVLLQACTCVYMCRWLYFVGDSYHNNIHPHTEATFFTPTGFNIAWEKTIHSTDEWHA
jgi:hypothetical protein